MPVASEKLLSLARMPRGVRGSKQPFAPAEQERLPFVRRRDRESQEQRIANELRGYAGTGERGNTDDNDNDNDNDNDDGNESESRGMAERVREKPLYLPVLFAAVGFVVAALATNWYCCKYCVPAGEDGEPQYDAEGNLIENADPAAAAANQAYFAVECKKERREKTITAGVCGAIAGMAVYFWQFREQQFREQPSE